MLRRIYGITEGFAALRQTARPRVGFARLRQTTRLLVNKTMSGGFAGATLTLRRNYGIMDLRNYGSTELRNWGYDWG